MSDLNKYHNWRKSLIPFEDGTIFVWNQDYKGLYCSDYIKQGTYMKVVKIDTSVIVPHKCNADLVYHLVLCTKNGVERKRQFRFTVEGIAKYYQDNIVSVV